MAHEEHFERFHAAHPDIYDELVRLAREARAAGFEHFGIRTIWETMRRHFAMERDHRSHSNL